MYYFIKNFSFLFLATFFPLKAEEQSSLWQTFDAALIPAVSEEIKDELLIIYESRQHFTSKRFWISAGESPRNFVEKAISGFLDCAKEEVANFKIYGNIYGAEWWVERTQGPEKTEFRFDTNELLAQGRHKIEFPMLSTITHFSTGGAPIVIFNTVRT